MYLKPLDIACYIYCPVLYYKTAYSVIAKPLSFFEEQVRKTIIDAERNACLKDSIVEPRKILKSWERIWWPAVAKNNTISMTQAQKMSLQAAYKFGDYCKYDISDWMFPTAGVDIVSEVKIGTSILKAKADVVKVDLKKTKNTVIINFDRKGLSLRSAGTDPAIRATAYAFYSGKGETITHISIDLSKKDNLEVITSTFRPKTLEGIRKMLYHVEYGIRSGAHYANPYGCKDCKKCQDFIL